jgi:hypothetical protein
MKRQLNPVLFILLILAGTPSLGAQPTTGPGQPASIAPVEAQQVLFVIDNSQSMTERGFDPEDPRASRWEIVKIPTQRAGL